MRKPLLLSSVLLVVMLLVPGSAMADLLTFSEVDPSTWALVVNRPAGVSSIGGFDALLGFDSAFTPLSVSPGDYLGNPSLLESFFDVSPGSGDIEIMIVSLLPESVLAGMQPLSFTLATIHFDISGDPGLHVITADVSDGFGNPVGTVPTPEPTTMILLGSGLAAFARWRRKVV